jgi:hypothetical protein
VNAYVADITKHDWGLEDKRLALSFKTIGVELVRENVEGFFHIWHPKSNWEDSTDGL